jgi:phospholipase/carboxylesterase
MRAILLSVLIAITMMNFKEKDKLNTLHYLVKHPKTENNKTPLLILLHGVGSNEKDLFSFADKLPDNYLIISARAPYAISPDSYAWYEVDFSTGTPVINKEKAEKSRNTIIEFIDELKAKYTFDDKQIYLCGFSQGAIMAYSVGLTRPDKIKGIAIMSGRLLEEVKPLIKPSDQLKQLQVFISHGTQDNVLGIHYAKESVAYLKGLGINPTFKEYSEGHGINTNMLNDLVNWLNSK